MPATAIVDCFFSFSFESGGGATQETIESNGLSDDTALVPNFDKVTDRRFSSTGNPLL